METRGYSDKARTYFIYRLIYCPRNSEDAIYRQLFFNDFDHERIFMEISDAEKEKREINSRILLDQYREIFEVSDRGAYLIAIFFRLLPGDTKMRPIYDTFFNSPETKKYFDDCSNENFIRFMKLIFEKKIVFLDDENERDLKDCRSFVVFGTNGDDVINLPAEAVFAFGGMGDDILHGGSDFSYFDSTMGKKQYRIPPKCTYFYIREPIHEGSEIIFEGVENLSELEFSLQNARDLSIKLPSGTFQGVISNWYFMFAGEDQFSVSSFSDNAGNQLTCEMVMSIIRRKSPPETE